VGAYDHTQPLVIDPILRYGTLLGGSGADVARGVAVDATGAAWVGGRTASADFPTTSGALSQVYLGGTYDAFVTKLNAAGTARLASTYLGGNDDDEGFALALDSTGRPYLTGLTYSTNFPTQNALMASGGAGFLTVLNTDGSLSYSSHISAIGRAIALDGNANAYIGGYVVNTPISTTVGAY
jgi:hypothetical protein